MARGGNTVWKHHLDLNQMVPLGKHPWALPVKGLTGNGIQVYRVMGRSGFYRRGGYDPDVAAYFVDRDAIGDLSKASDRFLQSALEEAAQNQEREQ